MAKWHKRIPNWLTGLRVLLIPLFVVALSDYSRSSLNIALVIFILAAITDYGDGIIARRYSAISDFGKLLDPLADKILVMAALVMLVSLQDERGLPFVPAWMVVLVLAREFWVTGLRAFAAKDGTVMAAQSGGKVKSFLQMVSIVALLLYDYSVSVLWFKVTFQYIGLNLLLVSIVFSYWSAVDYTMAVFFPSKGGVRDVAKAVGTAVLPAVQGHTPPENAQEMPSNEG
jgi:CDP-diacylglycerol--glycerol-3-phosphate 3-phosphatidyltransferase